MLAPILQKTTQLGARDLKEHILGGPNAHQFWYCARNHWNGPILGPLRIVRNYLVIYASKHLPSLALKRWLFRCIGMQIGRNVTISSGVTLDYFFPELISIGDNAIVGMDTMILTHEFLHDRFRIGAVRIGSNCLIAAQSTLLAGVKIDDNTTVAAMTLVNKGLPPNCMAGGIPVRIIHEREPGCEGELHVATSFQD